jgi:hypothetical protein
MRDVGRIEENRYKPLNHKRGQATQKATTKYNVKYE